MIWNICIFELLLYMLYKKEEDFFMVKGGFLGGFGGGNMNNFMK